KELGQRHTVLLSTHILSEVEAVCERVIIIANGRLGLQQALDEIEAEAKIWLETKGPVEQVTETLRKVEGVTDVTIRGHDDGWASIEVQTRENADLRETIGMAVSSRGWALRRLERKRRRLEDA